MSRSLSSGARRTILFLPASLRETGFSQRPSRPEITSCDARGSSNAEGPKPTVAEDGGHWRNVSSEFPALVNTWAKLFNSSRSGNSTGPVLFRKPARSMRAYFRRRRGPSACSGASRRYRPIRPNSCRRAGIRVPSRRRQRTGMI
jgi:hypothetical protein